MPGILTVRALGVTPGLQPCFQLKMQNPLHVTLYQMPSLSTLLSQYESALWLDYFALIGTLREHAVWRHEEDGEIRPNGLRKPARFIAVVEDAGAFEAFRKRAETLADLNTKWPPQFFDEVWGWARVNVGTGVHAKRLEAGLPVDVAPVKPEGREKALDVIQALEGAGHSAAVNDGHLVVTPGVRGLTIRTPGGRAFKCRAWSESGEMLHTLSVGVIVCRGIRQGVSEGGDGPRKQRKDVLHQVTSWGRISFWQ